ncbi:MAG: dCTP deaminase [Oscillospiraceae bacterium]|jgi:dCTP deaminase|nr:dCTP deaminase [Oscillospiraceae bacterium]
MILSGLEIERQIKEGRIKITPYDRRYLNPNSYNLRLHSELLVYTDDVLDMKKPLQTRKIIIPDTGLVLSPGVLYLGRTYEHTQTDYYVPMLEGRSSTGRLGLNIHVTAGFGDIGFRGYWTLEIQCVQPLRIYPMVEIGQIYYHCIEGAYFKYESDKYQDNAGIQPSMIHRDFEKMT